MSHDRSEWESICSCRLSVAAGAHSLCTCSCFFRFVFFVPAASDGGQSRELEVGVLRRDQAEAMCALSFLRLEEMMENQNNNQEIRLEPQGVLHAKVTSSCVQEASGLRELDTNPTLLCFISRSSVSSTLWPSGSPD